MVSFAFQFQMLYGTLLLTGLPHIPGIQRSNTCPEIDCADWRLC
jgi:hypothetical protein